MSKNIILQHWTGKHGDINKWSMENISNYANKCGAEYKFVEGNVFREDLCTYNQKLHMLDECYDDYDVVVMMDMDMFASAKTFKNIFDDDVTGIGVCDQRNRQNALNKLRSKFHMYYDKNAPFWGGSIYRLTKDVRRKLRKQIPNISEKNWKDMDSFEGMADEGLMHCLASKAKIPHDKSLLDERWSQGHFVTNIEDVYIIHVKHRIRKPDGTRIAPATKEENYKTLVERGIL